MYRQILFLILGFISFQFDTIAQEFSFSGTFVNSSSTIGLRIKPVESEYHGLVQANNGSLAFRSSVNDQLMTGKVYTAEGPVDFSASVQGLTLVVKYMGYTDYFYKISVDHELDDIDLTQYMVVQNNQNTTSFDNSQDYDHSYSQHSRGHATENKKTYSNSLATKGSPYPTLDDPEIFNLVAGTQLVFYTRTSYLSDNLASSITYVNYCPDGRFWLTYDGSFSVEGYYGDNAQGASNGRNSGYWQLVSYQGGPAVYLSFSNGNSSVYPINKQLILQGRWRNGNTQYAVQRNKVTCN